MNKYNPQKEIIIDLKKLNIKREIKQSKEIYKKFLTENYKSFDLSKPEKIDSLYIKAQTGGLFEMAKNIRKLIFGNKIYFYGVSYLWDACLNYCKYCPGSIPNREKARQEGRCLKLRELTIDQAVEDTLAVMNDGHKHICYLTGSTPVIEKYPDKIIPYLEKIIIKTKEYGLKEIILNIEPLTKEGFQKIANSIKQFNRQNKTQVSLQFRIFQETYNKHVYKKMHPQGPKADYNFRVNSQTRALEAGFDNIGLGALFGLNRYPLEEIEGLRKHAEKIYHQFGKRPARICLPSANELENIGVKIPFVLEKGTYGQGQKEIITMGAYEKFNELIYALARLAMPEINLVSSERDNEAMLKILDNYATCTTLNVHPGVGDNANIFSKDVHFEQATTFARDPQETLTDMKKRGFDPVV